MQRDVLPGAPEMPCDVRHATLLGIPSDPIARTYLKAMPPDRRRRRFAALVAAGALAACSPVQILNTLSPDRLYRSGIPYGPDPRLRLDIYRPAGWGPFPVAIFLYGGNWSSGRRAMYRFVGGALADAGVLTVIPDYRLYPTVRYPAFLDDCAAAVAWTRREISRHDGSTAPPFLLGHSAGAYNAAMLTLDRRWLAAQGLVPARDLGGTVGLAGPYDFLPLDTPMLRDLFAPAQPLESSQPIDHVDGREPRMLLLAGTEDRTVRPGNTTRLAGRIRASGGAVVDRLYPGVDHVEIVGAFAASLRFLAPSFHDTLRFLRGEELPA